MLDLADSLGVHFTSHNTGSAQKRQEECKKTVKCEQTKMRVMTADAISVLEYVPQ